AFLRDRLEWVENLLRSEGRIYRLDIAFLIEGELHDFQMTFRYIKEIPGLYIIAINLFIGNVCNIELVLKDRRHRTDVFLAPSNEVKCVVINAKRHLSMPQDDLHSCEEAVYGLWPIY